MPPPTQASSAALPTAAASRPGARFAFIASAPYDWAFLVFSPLIALAIAELLPLIAYPFEITSALGTKSLRITIFIGVFTSAHLVAVFFRSHANHQIFARHRFRFLGVPILLFLALVSSTWMFITAFVAAVLWDVYHSSMQNFGLCRIYDSKLGNPPSAGRKLDYWMNHVVYIGPILAGLSLMATLECFEEYMAVGWSTPFRWLVAIDDYRPQIRMAVIALGALFCLYYVYSYWRLSRSGYRVSYNKIALLVSVAITSICAWGFLPPLEAFFVSNLFHAAQYFAIVWWMEKKNIRRVFGLSRIASGQWLALPAFLVTLFVFGAALEYAVNSTIRWAGSIALVVALLHFWYDGFIWSVRKHDV